MALCCVACVVLVVLIHPKGEGDFHTNRMYIGSYRPACYSNSFKILFGTVQNALEYCGCRPAVTAQVTICD